MSPHLLATGSNGCVNVYAVPLYLNLILDSNHIMVGLGTSQRTVKDERASTASAPGTRARADANANAKQCQLASDQSRDRIVASRSRGDDDEGCSEVAYALG